MDWRLKAVVQHVLARTPGGTAVNTSLQRLFGERRDLHRHVASKLTDDWLVHMRHLAQLDCAIAGRHVVEVGTGWLPVMPLAFALAGAGRCTSFDVHRHLGRGAVRLTLRSLGRHLDAIADAAHAPLDDVVERWRAWTCADDVLGAAAIAYRAPADATRTGLPEGSVDLFFSNSVLEHVPPPVVDALMAEARRVLRPGGLALHGVNCGDHYAYADGSITPINYLRYGEREWRRWNNGLLYQNRLRPSDFTAAAERAGLEVLLDTHRARPELVAVLPRIAIAPEFRRYPVDDLCCTSVDFAACA